jgi:hypothetical protein
MPRTSVDGKACIQTSEGCREAVVIARGDISLIRNTPKGSMDENGYFTFRGKAMSIRKAQSKWFNRFSEPDVGLLTPFVLGPAKKIVPGNNPDRIITSFFGDTWKALSVLDGPPYAVVIGTTAFSSNANYGMFRDNRDISLMLVDEHAADRFHNIGYAKVEGEVTAGWVTQQLTVDGPLALESDGIARKCPFLQTSVDSAINS